MVYPLGHETTYLCASLERRRARSPRGGPPLVRCFRPPSVPNSAGQLQRRERLPDRQESWLQPPDRAQRHPRFQRQRTSGGPSARLQTSSYHSSGLRPRAGRGPARVVAQKPSRIRQSKQPVDDGYGRRSELRGGAHERAGKRGDHPGYAFAYGGALGAGQALDHFPRSRVRKKKRRRDRLIRLAHNNPDTWVIGFEDETWWSRLALPSLNSWAQAGEPMRLIQQSVAKDDPDPKANSCYGLYLPEFEEVWLRFVDGRPVSSITTRFLSWCCQRLQAAGKKVWLLVWDNASWHTSKEVREWITSHNWQIASALPLTVHITSIWPLPKMSPDRALGLDEPSPCQNSSWGIVLRAMFH